MRNENKWRPSKAILENGKLVPNLAKIFGGSYHTIKIQLSVYQGILKKYIKGELADLGCGNVPYFECYRKNISSVTCADWKENDFTDMTIDLSSLFPFENNRFDSVLFTDVFNHVFNFNNLLSETKRVLRPDGYMIIFTPFLYWISEAPHDYYRFTRFGLEESCRQHNLEVVELFSYGRRRDVIFDFIFKKYSNRFTFRFLKLFSQLFLQNNNVNIGFEPFPLGYILVAKKT